jgi:hypothetical protein
VRDVKILRTARKFATGLISDGRPKKQNERQKMRIDHLAFRVADRKKTVEFFQKALGYRIQTEFAINFTDDDVARCFALEPPEKLELPVSILPWVYSGLIYTGGSEKWDGGHRYQEIVKPTVERSQEYHMPPEIFVSDGTPGSIVGDWVAARGGE